MQTSKLPLGQMLNHATCDVKWPEAFETLMHGQCYGYYFLLLWVKYILFGFMEAFDSKGIINNHNTLR